MQEELERKMVVISLQTARLTGRVFKLALQKFLAELEKGGQIPKTFRGKQTVRHLVGQNAGVSSIEITDGNIRSFERSARRYGVDFALKRTPPYSRRGIWCFSRAAMPTRSPPPSATTPPRW